MAPGGIENLTPTFFGGPITTVSDVKVVSIDWHTDLGEAQRKLVKFKCKTSLLNLTRGIYRLMYESREILQESEKRGEQLFCEFNILNLLNLLFI